MPSPLLVNSEGFRKKLLTRNLVPYAKSPSKTTPPIDYEVIQSDLSVVDSPDQLIDQPSFANKLYTLNQWGGDGGYKQVPDPTGLLNSKSNEGEYGFQDAHLIDEGYDAASYWRPLNAYADTTRIFDSADAFSTLDIVYPNGGRGPNGQPYPTFNPSSYGPVSILLTNDPIGSNGLLSEDSFLAKVGAQSLKKDFENRIGREIIRNTVGRANILNVNEASDILSIASGRVPILEPNYSITVPSNPLIAATDFALKLAGSTIPLSPIPGSYFDTSINPGQPTTIQQLQNAFRNSNTGVGKFFSRLLGGDKSGSQLFLNNTGAGQKSRLFFNIDYNKFKPNYTRTLIDRLGGVLFGSETNNSNFYIGSTTSDPSRIFSPGGQIPVNQYGQEQQSPVYGPSELANLYEKPQGGELPVGVSSAELVPYSNGGGIEGGLTWVSPKYKGNAGKKVGVGGLIVGENENYKPSSYNKTESTNKEPFVEGSILYETQRLIDSQPNDASRYKHVGNAIDQVSKIFHDGTVEMTKGSRVLTYVGSIGNEVGTEYCRVFAKDVPYLQYNALQKINGMTTEGRKFAYSTLDKTYNLNIVPNKQEGGQSSTNLIGTSNNAVAQKYMFSLENLAWRTSHTPGYTVSDLAICERGPNGGRVMWFPPYELKFTESVSSNWQTTEFIGRPEAVYTYKNTNRTGTISWKIVVDHPSVLNLIVNKVLASESNSKRINQLIDSFYAGCLKYDLYELAKKYYTINPNDLQQLQDAISSKKMTKEQLQYSVKTLNTGNNGTTTDGPGNVVTSTETNNTTTFQRDSYISKGFYFDNEEPETTVSSYDTYYNSYTSSENKTRYQTYSPSLTTPYVTNPEVTANFFSDVVENNFTELQALKVELEQIFSNPESTGTIILGASSSDTALNDKRLDSVIEWFIGSGNIKKAKEAQKLTIFRNNYGTNSTLSTYTSVTRGKNGTSIPYSCIDATSKDSKVPANPSVYTVNAMACRRVVIENIEIKTPPPAQKPEDVTQPVKTPTSRDVLVGNKVPVTTTTNQVEQTWVQRDNITKRVLRLLLSECDYFETIKEDTPMVYDNLKQKLKFFQPAFHSMTPEGLNTRLTFLQQCMRPGETIPTVKTVDGKSVPDYDNATNTAFGAPPVLILRIGDFFNTKIIPDSLQINYENLDINPEGIGIQPMIANVSLNFKFIGGSGLKTAVDKLQNALSFNYYANTEIYDDRADVTDDSYKVIDNQFLKDIGFNVGPPTPNQVQNSNGQSNTSTIGNITTAAVSGITDGTITYKTFVDSFVSETQNYFVNFVNKSKECLSQYNNAVLQNWTASRLYTFGFIQTSPTSNTSLIGKPNLDSKGQGLGFRIDSVINQIILSANDGTDDYIKFMSKTQNAFSQKVIRQIKSNYQSYLTNKSSFFQNSVSQLTQSFTYSLQNYISYLSKANTITYNTNSGIGTDGSQSQVNGNVIVFNITGTSKVYAGGPANTYEELFDDVDKVKVDLNSFYDLISAWTEFGYQGTKYYNTLLFGELDSTKPTKLVEQVFLPISDSSSFSSKSFRRIYMILSQDVTDDKKYQSFKQSLIGNIVNNTSLIGEGHSNIEEVFDEFWLKTCKPDFELENTLASTFIDNMEKGDLKNYMIYTPFPSKEREFTYNFVDSPTSGQIDIIKSLNTGSNAKNQFSDNYSWNNVGTDSALISKIKLN